MRHDACDDCYFSSIIVPQQDFINLEKESALTQGSKRLLEERTGDVARLQGHLERQQRLTAQAIEDKLAADDRCDTLQSEYHLLQCLWSEIVHCRFLMKAYKQASWPSWRHRRAGCKLQCRAWNAIRVPYHEICKWCVWRK